MNAERSETLFKDYLDAAGLAYEREYYVGPGNVDFAVHVDRQYVLLDVKEVRDRKFGVPGRIDASVNIQSDLRKLRRKFGVCQPEHPCALVTMNFSRKFFTGLTVSRALHGDIGLTLDVATQAVTSAIHHPRSSGAAITNQQNTGISGVLVFDWRHDHHRFFGNPFARRPLPTGVFPGVEYETLDRRLGANLVDLSRLMYFGEDA